MSKRHTQKQFHEWTTYSMPTVVQNKAAKEYVCVKCGISKFRILESKNSNQVIFGINENILLKKIPRCIN